MPSVTQLRKLIVNDLEAAGKASPYPTDADEPDPRYLAYGVRAAGKAAIIKQYKSDIRSLTEAEKLDLARQLLKSKYGELCQNLPDR